MSPARPRFGVAGAALGAQLAGDAVALGDDGAALGGGERGAVGVADLVGGAGPPAGDDPGEQGGGDVAERGVVMLAAGDHEPVVAGGEGRVGAAGGVRGHEQGLAQRGVAGFCRWAVAAIDPGGGQGGDQAAEGPGAGEGLEPGGVAEAGEDLRAVDDADAGDGGHDGGRFGLVQQAGELGVQIADLRAGRQGQPG